MAETVPDQTDIQPPAAPPVVVKKYANRRLYNTETSSYITLENLAEMVRQGRDFVVYDAKSGEDITRGVLTQIIVEEEGKGRNLLPTNFLRQLIGFYGDSMQAFVPRYLEQSMEVLAQQQDKMRDAMQKTMGNLFPFGGAVNEMSRQNMAMMERAFSLFSPFHRPADEAAGKAAAQEIETLRAKAAMADRLQEESQAIRAQVESQRKEADALRAELDAKRGSLADAASREDELARLRAELDAQRRALAEAASRDIELVRLRAEVETQRRELADAAERQRELATDRAQLEAQRKTLPDIPHRAPDQGPPKKASDPARKAPGKLSK